jgi:integrase
MTAKSCGGGVYENERGFWARPWVNGKRTWRKLKAQRLREAHREANSEPFTKSKTFGDLADQYLTSKCPNRRLEERDASFCKTESSKLVNLNQFFGRMMADEIRLFHLPRYKDWRVKQVKRKTCTGTRAVDIELATLSNVLNYGVSTGQLEFNYVRSGRPSFQKDSEVRHCREVAVASGDELHKIARWFFRTSRSDVLGWLQLFQAMSGCRMSELLRLRVDAKTPDDPGYIEGNHLFLGRRSKHGVNPWVFITPEFKTMLDAFFKWRQLRCPKSPWFFAGKDRVSALESGALTHGLKRAVKALSLRHRASHGNRSFYVTKRRSDGALDVEIAAEIGDQDVTQISRTYGSRPPNWDGMKRLRFLPEKGEPAWKFSFKEIADKTRNRSPLVVHLRTT